jgi:hypothetical protein
MKVEIMFTKSDTIISDGIALVTNCPASHVLVKIGAYVWEPRGDKPHSQVIKQRYTDMIAHPKLQKVWTKEIFVYDILQAIEWLDSRVGVDYDYYNTGFLQLVKILTGRLIGQRRISVADDKYQCAEYVAHFVMDNMINSYVPRTAKIAEYSPKTHFDIVKPILIFER